MKLVITGPQGSGKGTQAKILAKKLNIIHISTGELFRNAQGSIKEEIDSYINKGNLVPDELTVKMLKERISQPDAKKGFILDGFPRNLEQSKSLDNEINIDKVIEISLSNEEAIKRLSGRRFCPRCGREYNLETSPKPKENNLCDNCGLELKKRNDDNPEAIKKRLEIYHNKTKPILEHYKKQNKLISINGEDTIENVQEKILKKLNIEF